MENLHSVHLRQIQSRLGNIAYQLTKVRFHTVMPRSWSPAINAYRCRECIAICMDLAGVDKTEIELSVQPRRIVIRGERRPLAPGGAEGSALQVLALEIDEGPFERELLLPEEVEPQRARAEQQTGLLWIWLPLAAPNNAGGVR